MDALTLRASEYCRITDEDGGEWFGGNQYWLRGVASPSLFRAEAACGATALANILWYLLHTRADCAARYEAAFPEHRGFLRLLQTAYRYATPGPLGLTGGMFLRGAEGLCARLGPPFPRRASILRIRPMLFRGERALQGVETAAWAFLSGALAADIPAAFLVLSDGRDTAGMLDTWHWVTVTAAWRDPLRIEAADNGVRKTVDLSEWLRTSALGGAFVSLADTDSPQSAFSNG